MQLKIRPFRNSDAERLAEWLDALAPAEDVFTPAVVVHQRRMLPAREHPLWLVAVVDGEPVGLGRDEPQIFGSRPGLRRTWVGVRPDLRRRGIGSRLWQAIEAHVREVRGKALRSWAVADQSDSEPFLLARGFARTQRELQSWVDPRAVVSGDQPSGFRVVTLREVLAQMEPPLRRLFVGAA
jgi:GNAT superfamily N-acetyltransferase